MDFLRMEGEAYFLTYMPPHVRLDMLKSWYIQDDSLKKFTKHKVWRESRVEYKTTNYKSEFFDQVVNRHILKSTNIKFDDINYYKKGKYPPKMPKKFETVDDIKNGFRSLTVPGTNFLKYVSDHGINTVLLRIRVNKKENYVGTIVINRWHDNVNSLFGEKSRLNSKKDTLDFIVGSIGSYPNMFAVVDDEDLPDFFDLIKNFEKNEKYFTKIKKYFISRDSDRFWETYDWFQEHFNKSNPTEAGLYDLNRYYRSIF
jgi:hypothetical protein